MAKGMALAAVCSRVGGERSLPSMPGAAVTAAITSAPTPHIEYASSTTSSRPVRETEAMTVSVSSGTTVRRSTTSQSIPPPARASAAARTVCTCAPHATTVMSAPARTTFATPKGTYSSSTGISSIELKRDFGSMKMTGSSV